MTKSMYYRRKKQRKNDLEITNRLKQEYVPSPLLAFLGLQKYITKTQAEYATNTFEYWGCKKNEYQNYNTYRRKFTAQPKTTGIE